jgi:hypothetical protein
MAICRENWSSRENTPQCYFVHHNSYLGSNPGRRSRNSETSLLSYGTTQTLCCRSSNYCSCLTGSNPTRDRFFSDFSGSLIFFALPRAVDHDDLSLQPFPTMRIRTSRLTLATTYFLYCEDSWRAVVVSYIWKYEYFYPRSWVDDGVWAFGMGKGNATINYFATVVIVLIDSYHDRPV